VLYTFGVLASVLGTRAGVSGLTSPLVPGTFGDMATGSSDSRRRLWCSSVCPRHQGWSFEPSVPIGAWHFWRQLWRPGSGDVGRWTGDMAI